jgi:hypothetical protein
VKSNIIATHEYHQLRSLWDVFTFVYCQCVTIVWLRDLRSSERYTAKIDCPERDTERSRNVGNYHSVLRNIP